MKTVKLFLNAVVAIMAAAVVVSCDKSEVNTNPSDNLVHLTLKANRIDTKTAVSDMGDGAWQPVWQETDKLGVITSIPNVSEAKPWTVNATFDAELKDQGMTAEFSGTINVDDSDSQTLYGIVPATALQRAYKNGLVGLDVPTAQNPTSVGNGIYALAGDVLVSKPVTFTIVDNEGIANDDLFFKRLTSTIKLNLKFPDNAVCTGDKILSVSMESAKALIAGRISVNLETGESNAVNTYGQTPRLVTTNIEALNTDVASNVPVFLSVAPVEMKSTDGSIIFTIRTDNYTITKTVTGKDLTFKSGEIYTIGLDLTESSTCVYKSEGEVENPNDDTHEVTVGRHTIALNKDFYSLSASGNNAAEQSAWSQEGIKIVSGCESSATSKTYYDASHIRYYAGSYLKLSVPSGYEILQVAFTPSGTWNDDGISCGSNGKYSDVDKVWTGRSSSIDFSFTKQCRIATITVNVVKAGETPIYRLTINTAINGSISATVDGSPVVSGAQIELGKSVTITATPASNFEFDTWNITGATVGSTATETFTMNGDVTVGATFKEKETTGTGSKEKDSAAKYTLAPKTGSNNAYASDCDVTIDGITWNVTGNASLTPWRLGGKSISNVDRTVYSKNAYANELWKVSLTVGEASSITVNSLKLIYSTNADFSEAKEISGTFTANSTIDFEAEFPAGCYYKFIFNVTVSSTSNKYFEFTKAEFFGYKN